MLRTETVGFMNKEVAEGDLTDQPFSYWEHPEEVDEDDRTYAVRQVEGRFFLGTKRKVDRQTRGWRDVEVLLFSGLVVFEYEDES